MPQEERVFFCFLVSLGLFSALFSVFLLMLESPLSGLYVGTWHGGIPAICMFPVLTAIILMFTRMFAYPLGTKRGGRIIWLFAFVGGCLAPYGLLHPLFWPVAVVLLPLGLAAIMYIWWSHLCSLGHRLLSTLVAAAFTLSALLVALIGAINLGALATIIISSCSMAVSCALCYLVRDETLDSLLAVDPRDSAKHLHGPYDPRLGQLNYFTMGTVFGVEMGLVFIFHLFGNPLVDVTTTAFLITIPVIVAGIILLVFHYLFEFGLEKFSKDYLSFTITLGFVFLPFVSDVIRIVCFMFLLTVVMMQIIMIATAIIELIRFEEISPLWYMGEFAYLFGGTSIGLIFVWMCGFDTWGSWGLVACCFATILFASFAQVLINRVTYPAAYMYEPTIEKVEMLEGAGHLKGGAFWKRKVAYIDRQYDLSPRQCEILELLAKGRDVAFIVDHFYISRSTAKTHIYNIYRKLGIHSRQELLDIIDAVELPDV